MKSWTFIARWARRGGTAVGLILTSLAWGQNAVDVSNPAMEEDSFVSESTEEGEAKSAAPDPATRKDSEAAATMPAAPKESQPTRDEAETEESVTEGEVEVIDLQEAVLPDESWDSTTKAKQAQDLSGQVSIEEIVDPPGEYHYAAFGRPNPFLPPRGMSTAGSAPTPRVAMSLTGEVTVAGTEIPVVSPLQTYALDRLELKGIWQLQSGEMRAIVMTPDKEGIIVKVNDPISAGKVLTIGKDFVTVRQYRLRTDGVREFNDERIALGGDYTGQPQGAVKLNPGKEPEFTTPKEREENLPNPMPAEVKPAAPAAGGAAPAAAAVPAANAVPTAVKADGENKSMNGK